MKTKIFFIIMFSCLSGIAFAQYVSNQLQQQIIDDQNRMAADMADYNTRNADIQNIITDSQAQAVTSNVPAIATAVQAQIVSPSQPISIIKTTPMGVQVTNSAS